VTEGFGQVGEREFCDIAEIVGQDCLALQLMQRTSRNAEKGAKLGVSASTASRGDDIIGTAARRICAARPKRSIEGNGSVSR
jgi:hypothetical protein